MSHFSNSSSTFYLNLLMPLPFSTLFCPIPNSFSYGNSHGCPQFLIFWRIYPLWGSLRVSQRCTCPRLPGLSLGLRDSWQFFPLYQNTPLKLRVFYLLSFLHLEYHYIDVLFCLCNANKLTFVTLL